MQQRKLTRNRENEPKNGNEWDQTQTKQNRNEPVTSQTKRNTEQNLTELRRGGAPNAKVERSLTKKKGQRHPKLKTRVV